MRKLNCIIFLSLIFISCNKEIPNKTLKDVNYYFGFKEPSSFLCEKKIIGKNYTPIGPTEFNLFIYAKLSSNDHSLWLERLEKFNSIDILYTRFSIRKWYPKSLIQKLILVNKGEIAFEKTKFFQNVDLKNGLFGNVIVFEDKFILFELFTM